MATCAPASVVTRVIRDEDLLQVLRSFNPWWTTGKVPEHLVPPVRRAAYHALRSRLRQPKWRRAFLLQGPRRVGKTTLLYQLAADALAQGDFAPKQVLYLSFDHPIAKLARFDQLLRIFQEVGGWAPEQGGHPPSALLLLDEIQYTADWASWLKWLVDQHPRFRVVATGSATARLEMEGAEPGVGRWVSVPVPPLSFFEYVALRGLSLPEVDDLDREFLWLRPLDQRAALRLVEQTRVLKAHFQRYLLLGGFPEIALLDDPDTLDLLRVDVVDRVLKRDMVALFNVRNVLELERLFVYLCLHTGEIINRETLARELGVTGPTVDNYLAAVEAAHLIALLPNVDTGGKKLLRTRPKAYLTHPSLRSAVLMLGEQALTDATLLGHLVETAVVAYTLSYASPLAPWAGYWRDASSGREVDLVLTLPRATALVEVKYQPRPQIRPNEGLLSYRRGDPSVVRWLITREAEDAGPDQESGVVRLPAFTYLYLLGWLAQGGG